MPLYAELQRGEAAHTDDHLAHGVPDLRVATLPTCHEDLVQRALPLDYDEISGLREFAPRFAALCDELAALDLPETLQHDDLHMGNLYAQGERLRVLDWGDSSISHPFASLVVNFRGVGVSSARSHSPSASARSRIPSPGRGRGMHWRKRRAQSSTVDSRSCYGARSLRRSSREPKPGSI